MNSSKPGLIRRLFIYWRLERLTAAEVVMQQYHKRCLDEILTLDPKKDGSPERIAHLKLETVKAMGKLLLFENKKSKLYQKLGGFKTALKSSKKNLHLKSV